MHVYPEPTAVAATPQQRPGWSNDDGCQNCRQLRQFWKRGLSSQPEMPSDSGRGSCSLKTRAGAGAAGGVSLVRVALTAALLVCGCSSSDGLVASSGAAMGTMGLFQDQTSIRVARRSMHLAREDAKGRLRADSGGEGTGVEAAEDGTATKETLNLSAVTDSSGGVEEAGGGICKTRLGVDEGTGRIRRESSMPHPQHPGEDQKQTLFRSPFAEVFAEPVCPLSASDKPQQEVSAWGIGSYPAASSTRTARVDSTIRLHAHSAERQSPFHCSFSGPFRPFGVHADTNGPSYHFAELVLKVGPLKSVAEDGGNSEENRPGPRTSLRPQYEPVRCGGVAPLEAVAGGSNGDHSGGGEENRPGLSAESERGLRSGLNGGLGPGPRRSPSGWVGRTLRRPLAWGRGGVGGSGVGRGRWGGFRRAGSERRVATSGGAGEEEGAGDKGMGTRKQEPVNGHVNGHVNGPVPKDGKSGFEHRWNLSGLTDHRAGGWSKLEGAWNKVIKSMEKGLDFEGAGESSSSSKWPATKEDKAKAGRSKDFKALALATYYRALGEHDKAEHVELNTIRDKRKEVDLNIGPDAHLVEDVSDTPLEVDETAEWRRLETHQKSIHTKHLKDMLQDEERTSAFVAEHEGTILDYSRMNVSQVTMRLLVDLALRQKLAEKIAAMFNGKKINNTENRAVLHVALRSPRDADPIYVDGVDVIQQVHDSLDKVREFSEAVRKGKKRGATGKMLKNIVAVGIGGSYLGPEFVHEAFKTQEYPEREHSEKYRLRFLSNVDPVDVRRTLYDLDPEETLVVVISKTFTTAETMLNARTARQWLWDSMGKDPEVVQKHLAACASESAMSKVIAFGIPEDRLFPLWDWVGGRYSVCSSVGALPLCLKYGFRQFDHFLQGARSMDEHFRTAPFEQNLPVLMGLLGVWNISFMGYKTRTILPYAEALLKFPAHIQQLAMESNGKRVTTRGTTVRYDIGQVDFGEPGTNGQHSFFQLLHMGQICPAEFIGFIESQHPLHVEGEPICSHDELMANFFAQPDALAMGKPESALRREGCREDLIPHRTFEGNRPSLSLLVPKVNSYHVGMLLALYEHRTAVEGFVWDINSFDQWGVELGKSLATSVRQQMQEFREDSQSTPKGMNPSTLKLITRYLRQSESVAKKEGEIHRAAKLEDDDGDDDGHGTKKRKFKPKKGTMFYSWM